MNQPTELGSFHGSLLDWEAYLESYYEKPQSTRTRSGHEVKAFYAPQAVDPGSYPKRIGDPGSYPFTRGIHRDMLRGRY